MSKRSRDGGVLLASKRHCPSIGTAFAHNDSHGIFENVTGSKRHAMADVMPEVCHKRVRPNFSREEISRRCQDAQNALINENVGLRERVKNLNGSLGVLASRYAESLAQNKVLAKQLFDASSEMKMLRRQLDMLKYRFQLREVNQVHFQQNP